MLHYYLPGKMCPLVQPTILWLDLKPMPQAETHLWYCKPELGEASAIVFGSCDGPVKLPF